VAALVLTLEKARTELYDTVVFSPEDPKFRRYLNHLCMRFVDSGDWARSLFIVSLPEVGGMVTLPRRASACVGIRFSQGSPRAVYPMAHEFSEAGPSEQDAGFSLSSVFELPDVCVQQDIAAGGSLLTLTPGEGDVGEDRVARIYGVGTDGRRLIENGSDGVSLDISDGAATTEAAVARIDSVVLPVTSAHLTLTDADDNVLAVYEPGETHPSYRRYKVGQIPAGHTVEVLCNRRHVDVIAETDLVFPSNLGALKNGLIALRLEDDSDVQTAAVHMRTAYELLNNELRRTRGIARPVPQMRNRFGKVRSFY